MALEEFTNLNQITWEYKLNKLNSEKADFFNVEQKWEVF